MKIDKNLANKINSTSVKHKYTTKTEFIREAIRDKIRKLEEKEILEDKELMSQVKLSEQNIKKGKVKEFKY